MSEFPTTIAPTNIAPLAPQDDGSGTIPAPPEQAAPALIVD
jgi:hypothetical protein